MTLAIRAVPWLSISGKGSTQLAIAKTTTPPARFAASSDRVSLIWIRRPRALSDTAASLRPLRDRGARRRGRAPAAARDGTGTGARGEHVRPQPAPAGTSRGLRWATA